MKRFFKRLTPYQKRYMPIYTTMALLGILFLIIILAFPTSLSMQNKSRSSRSGWPIRLAAPYIDMSSWVAPTNAYSINGAPDLGKLSDDSGFKYFNLGFIQPATTNPLASDGNIIWGWGGYASLNKDNSSNVQYQGIVQSLNNLRAKGGDFAISIGGQLGDAPWVVTQNQNALENFYNDIIETYDLKRLDLDIEMSNQDYNQNIINARAIKKVQDQTGVEITLTIPIMPHGWDEKQTNLIKAYFDQGVAIQTINSMTMCYGTGVYENEDYGTASVRAMNNAHRQIKEIYSNYGNIISDELAYQKLGATYSIGYESNVYPVFNTEMSKSIIDDAKLHNYGLISFWSMGRDAKLEENSGVKTAFEFSNLLKEYNTESE